MSNILDPFQRVKAITPQNLETELTYSLTNDLNTVTVNVDGGTNPEPEPEPGTELGDNETIYYGNRYKAYNLRGTNSDGTTGIFPGGPLGDLETPTALNTFEPAPDYINGIPFWSKNLDYVIVSHQMRQTSQPGMPRRIGASIYSFTPPNFFQYVTGVPQDAVTRAFFVGDSNRVILKNWGIPSAMYYWPSIGETVIFPTNRYGTTKFQWDGGTGFSRPSLYDLYPLIASAPQNLSVDNINKDNIVHSESGLKKLGKDVTINLNFQLTNYTTTTPTSSELDLLDKISGDNRPIFSTPWQIPQFDRTISHSFYSSGIISIV